MMGKQDALAEITAIAKRHSLTAKEITAALHGTPESREHISSSILSRLFGYMGGILLFCGVGIFIAMQWDDMNSFSRVFATLGIGFCAFIMAVTATKKEQLARAATPLFLVAAFLESAGIMVALDEYSRGGDPMHGILFMATVMTLQMGLTFISLKTTTLAFLAIFFGAVMTGTALDIMGARDKEIIFILGLSFSFLGWGINKTRHAILSPAGYFFGSIMVLAPLFDWLENTSFEVLFLGASSGVIYLSTLVRSRMLLTVGTIATIGYIGYFSEEHFRDTLGWPILLMFMGLVLIGLSHMAVKINQKFMQQG
ncbi:MAG: DUF2157 domain-containing protein [Alphaproteobacteria bacterium]|nr:DUF2157 domain-containing protein [Alphaproteobacteria bacterium]